MSFIALPLHSFPNLAILIPHVPIYISFLLPASQYNLEISIISSSWGLPCVTLFVGSSIMTWTPLSSTNSPPLSPVGLPVIALGFSFADKKKLSWIWDHPGLHSNFFGQTRIQNESLFQTNIKTNKKSRALMMLLPIILVVSNVKSSGVFSISLNPTITKKMVSKCWVLLLSSLNF